jgi:hypothetical protein
MCPMSGYDTNLASEFHDLSKYSPGGKKASSFIEDVIRIAFV